ncbi:hypothetical protein SS1G_07273 [Sclerotinia sclerotiorum 1980 UF-70]|uniref:tetrahydrofolate synthase n=1 Tax=Sclerotinia sclerotiorum (strain ATCC 18683 / 1980 / Ss-1) TaxID=665079 RepID=A7EPM4_SCLS1|nr:hypothetical protein SS1G_07273 [Sclerotinia sclerotiorum 1980 UF-70]EDO04790.1 hypothetical protein SS1G_07273 [Sclerotinia sclerotiorum 1980 UF-70]
MERSYRNAVTLLESRKYRVKISRRSRASQLLKKTTCGSSGGEDSSSERTKNRLSTSGGIPKKPENESMNEWLDALGYTHKEFHVIHVTGTKGKESTCMFVKSFLSSYASRTGVLRKIGLYTNPYSPNIREPIKINSKPISEDKFARYFFEVWEILSSKFSETMMPDYMQLRLLVAVYAFICEDVDVAIMETHSGGDNDATNFVKPTAVGIAQIHVDYIDAGDPSSTDLAWHAGGIMKTNAPAFSIPQNPDVRKVLEERANEKAVSLNFVTEDHRLPITAHALKTDIKRYGCSLALALTDAYLISTCDEKYPTLSSEDISIGLDRFFWPGRFHKLELGQNSWFLDGAHHPQTVPKAAEWFALSVVESLVKALERHRCKIKHVIFTTDWDDSSKITDSDTSAMRSYAQTWQNLSPNSSILLEPNNTAAIDLATRIGYQNHAMECLVTGSLYLTGSALRYLDPAAEKM